MRTGVIFDIKEFSIYDGPGIRQTVFLKGCPLQCSWCHNPEGQKMCPELMVSKTSCISCGRCKKVCDNDKCVACGKCVPQCPLNLRKICGKYITSEDVAEYIMKNSDYYSSYGGGVTFSGGEPLMQAEFLSEILSHLADIHTAIETSAYADSETFKSIVRQIDHVMIDVKLVDSELHIKYTGVDNIRILENLAFLCSGDKKFTVRIPVIPGVNDSESNFCAVAELIKDAPLLERVELLPYHKTAGAKYEMVNRKFNPMFDVNRQVSISQGIFSQYGIRSVIL
mgnify:CR=1 FL=1